MDLNHRIKELSRGQPYDRLVWYREPATEEYWLKYFARVVTPAYYRSAAQINLAQHEIGKVLAQELAPQERHLEAGCGAGFWVAALCAHGYTVEGIDYSEQLIERVKSVCEELPVRAGNALAIDTPAEYYDTYLSFGVIEHRQDGPEPFLQEARRVIKTGGKIILSVPALGPLRRLKSRLGAYHPPAGRVPFYQYGFSKAEVQHFLETIGFRVTSTRYILLDRLLQEELPIYGYLSGFRRLRPVQKWLSARLAGLDGHMLLVVAIKIPGDRSQSLTAQAAIG